MRAAWDIREGDPAYINRVTIVGNTFTHEDVIRNQVIMVPGDVYSEQLLIESYRRIGATGFFEMPMPTPRIEPQENGDVNITFEVKEKQTGSVNFGTAVGGGSGLAGFLGYDQPNLFGKAKGGHLRWESVATRTTSRRATPTPRSRTRATAARSRSSARATASSASPRGNAGARVSASVRARNCRTIRAAGSPWGTRWRERRTRSSRTTRAH